MGMTIDEAIEFKKHGYHTCLSVFEDDMDAMNAHIGKCAEYDKLAFDTLRKYQKIREIAFPLQFCSTDKLEHEAIMKICEVLEDGNVD